MTVLTKLSTSLGRKDQVPNQDLAKAILAKKNHQAIEELVLHLKDKKLQGDCIKVLYEIGERDPSLIAKHDKVFLDLLDSKNNRLVWGAMTALDYIASVNPEGIYKKLAKIMMVADTGSVITVDHAVNILIKLAAHKKYADSCLVLLKDRMKTCATNQLPKYAEDAFAIIPATYKKDFVNILSKRVSEIEKESKQKRLQKVIQKLSR